MTGLWTETGLRELVCGEENEDEQFNEVDETMSKQERRELWYPEIFLNAIEVH